MAAPAEITRHPPTPTAADDGSGGSGADGRLALLAEVEQRQQMAEFLHDDVLQTLGATLLKLEICQRLHALGRVDQARQELETLRTGIEGTVDKLRDLMLELRPCRLTDGTLAASVQSYANQFSACHGIPVELTVATEHAPGPEDARGLLTFRFFQELCALGRSGGVESIRVAIASEPGGVALRAVYSRAEASDAPPLPAAALQALRSRVGLIGGSVRAEMSGPALFSLELSLS